jgi:hypothetical protein
MCSMIPRMSVVVPTYNRARLAAQAIDSVLAQSMAEFEIVVVDDGSSDDTRQVVAAYDDPRIRYVYQDNAGLGAARNTGIAHAQAEYIAFLDSDDLFLPEGLARQLATLESAGDIGLVAGGWLVVNELGQAMAARRPWRTSPRLDVDAALRALNVVPSGVVVRKSWLTEVGGFANMRRAEDSDLWLRLAYRGCRMAWTEHSVCAYRIHTGQMVRDGRSQKEAHLVSLDQFFAQADLPVALEQERPRIYAAAFLAGAWREYGANQIEDARRSLARAIELDPSLMEGMFPGLANALAGWAADPSAGDPTAYIERVLANLPPAAARLSALRQRFVSLAVVRAAVDAVEVDNLPLARRYLAGAHTAGYRLEEDPSLLVELAADAARSRQGDQEAIIQRLFASFPPEAQRIPGLRRKTLGRLHMARCFSALSDGNRREARRSAWRGVLYDLTWLKNRGVLSLLVKPMSAAFANKT